MVLQTSGAAFEYRYHCVTLFNSLAMCDLMMFLLACICFGKGMISKIRLGFGVFFNSLCFRFKTCAMCPLPSIFLTSLFYWQNLFGTFTLNLLHIPTFTHPSVLLPTQRPNHSIILPTRHWLQTHQTKCYVRLRLELYLRYSHSDDTPSRYKGSTEKKSAI